MEQEIWKPIGGYEGFYEASNRGVIRSLDRVGDSRIGNKKLTGRILRTYNCAKKNGDKQNNFDSNLEWSTYGANNQHAYDTKLKTSKQGKEHHAYKHGNGCKGTARKCLWCGISFVPIFSRGIYCSRSCKSIHQHKKLKT